MTWAFAAVLAGLAIWAVGVVVWTSRVMHHGVNNVPSVPGMSVYFVSEVFALWKNLAALRVVSIGAAFVILGFVGKP